MLGLFQREIRVLLAGGGTGGHIFPLQAIAEELRQLGAGGDFRLRIAYVGPQFFQLEPFLAQNVEIYPVRTGKWRRYRSLRNISDLLWVFVGFWQALWRVYLFMPDVIFSKGGHGALPAVLASVFFFIPLAIHESDVRPGAVNSYSARKARRIAVSFSETQKFFSPEKTAVVGVPIRRALLKEPNLEGLRQGLEFDVRRKTILVLGGSQGAQILNDLILDILPDLLRKYQVIHQCGPENYESFRDEAQFVLQKLIGWEQSHLYKLHGFLMEDNLRGALALADIVIARAGSGTIFELAIAKKPSILVPLPHAAGDHQRLNAYAYAETGAAVVIEQENLKPHLVLSQIENILEDSQRLEKMKKASKEFSRPEAGTIIAKELLRIAGISI